MQDLLKELTSGAKVPVVCDAGVGCPSDAAIAMELGCDGVLMNTAIAEAGDAVLMAEAVAVAKRSSGFFARARFITSCSVSEIPSMGGGGSKICLWSRLNVESESKGTRPASIS